MFKLLISCLFAMLAYTNAKPGLVAPLAYSAPLVASPYAATAYASPYYSAYTTSLASPYIAPYAAAYSAYPYSSVLLRR